MADRRMHAIVHGRVQGVFFRESTREAARRLGLAGWVRNLPDGTVETVFEGDEHEVNRLAAWLQTGSPLSRVDRVDLRSEPVTGAFNTFAIRF